MTTHDLLGFERSTQTFNVLVKHIGIYSRDVLSYGPGIGVQMPFERNKS